MYSRSWTFGSRVPAGRQAVALGDRERLTVVIAGSVKPGQIVEALHLDDKRVAIPPAVRPPIQVKEQKIDTPLRRFTQSWNYAGELSADGTTISGVTSSIQGGAQLVFRKR